ncbi:MAG TPA: hypothetical protein VEJ63_10365 [Planctomycetota bacterium]|nr:hypothetical protein [Planctomycetota bacterium]
MATTLISLSCNHCGAPLSIPEQTKFVTCKHCNSRLQVEHSDSAYFTSVLDRVVEHTEAAAGELEIIRLQNDLEQIDREWQMRRESLMIRDKRGNVSEPQDPGIAEYLVTAWGIIFCIVFICITLAIFPPMALFGGVALVITLLQATNNRQKRDLYASAHQRYRERRAEATKKLREAKERISA